MANRRSNMDIEDLDDNFQRPSALSQLLVVQSPTQAIEPDTEEHVQAQTEDLFCSFVHQRYREDNIRDRYENIPATPALVNLPIFRDTQAAEIGRQLARIGDDINERYADTFNSMIKSLHVGPETAYEAFAGVARRLFQEGTNWGRIITLLCFGYRMAIHVLRQSAEGFTNFLRQICQYVIQFLAREKISRWIASNGGWRGALTFSPSIDNSTFFAIASLAAVSVICVIAWHRFYQV